VAAAAACVGVAGFALYRSFVPAKRPARSHSVAGKQRFDAPIRRAAVDRTSRPVYPFSVIRGGVYDAGELQIALATDRVAAGHYAGFDAHKAQREVVARDRQVYVSYRIGDKVFWSKRAFTLREGETLLSDGTHSVRSRCGNRISDTPRQPVSRFEPRAIDSDVAELPTPPETIAEIRARPLGPMLAPEIFPSAASPSVPIGGHEIPVAALVFVPPWASAVTSAPVPGGPLGGAVGEIFQPLPVAPLPPVLSWTIQAPISGPWRIPTGGAEVTTGPAIVVQLLRPPTPSRTPAGGKPETPSGGSSNPGPGAPPGEPVPPDVTNTPGGPGPSPAPPVGPPELPWIVIPPTFPPPETPETPPSSVPEPVTGLSMAGALALLAGWLAWRRRARE
jgi:hypothetical protein